MINGERGCLVGIHLWWPVVFVFALPLHAQDTEPALKGRTVSEWTEVLRKGGAEAPTAAWALGSIGPGAAPAVPALIEALDRPSEQLRRYAAWALGEMGPAASTAATALESRLDDESLNVCANAATALVEIGKASKLVVAPLVKALRRGDEDGRKTAVWALNQVESIPFQAIRVLVDATTDERWEVRECAINALGRAGPRSPAVVAALARRLRDERPDLRQAALFVLGNFQVDSEPAVPDLKRILREGKDPVARQIAAMCLAAVGPRARAVPELIAALNDKGGKVRLAAVEALGWMGPSAAPALAQLLEATNDPDKDVRNGATGSLVSIGPAAVEQLVKILNSGNPPLRSKAAIVLGEACGAGRPAVPHLLNALDHEDTRLRVAAATALGNIGDETAVSRLIQALDDDETSVREAASTALGHVGRPAVQRLVSILKLKREETDLCALAIGALEVMGPEGAPAAPVLGGILGDASQDLRLRAVRALGVMGAGAKTQTALLRNRLKEDASSEVRASAARALGRLRHADDGVTVAALVTALESKNAVTREAAAFALGLLGEQASGAVAALRRLQGDESGEVQRWASVALGMIDKDAAGAIEFGWTRKEGPLNLERKILAAEELPDAEWIVIQALDGHRGTEARLTAIAIVGRRLESVDSPLLPQLVRIAFADAYLVGFMETDPRGRRAAGAFLWRRLGWGAPTPPKANTIPDNILQSALRHAKEGQQEAAARLLLGGVLAFPHHPPLRFELARLACEQGEAAARQHGAKAQPYYVTAGELLRHVVRWDTNAERAARASYLLMGVHVFLEEWRKADVDLERAIRLRKPEGATLKQWREIQANLREKSD